MAGNHPTERNALAESVSEKDRHHRFGASDEESDVDRALGGLSWPFYHGKQGGTASKRLVPHLG